MTMTREEEEVALADLREKQNQAVRDDLVALAREGAPLIGHGAIIYTTATNRRGLTATGYISGIPYLWTGFAERAFRFASVKQAEDFLTRHPYLENATISNLEKL